MDYQHNVSETYIPSSVPYIYCKHLQILVGLFQKLVYRGWKVVNLKCDVFHFKFHVKFMSDLR